MDPGYLDPLHLANSRTLFPSRVNRIWRWAFKEVSLPHCCHPYPLHIETGYPVEGDSFNCIIFPGPAAGMHRRTAKSPAEVRVQIQRHLSY